MPTDLFQVGSEEALLFSNSDELDALLEDGEDRLVGALAQIEDDTSAIDEAFLATVSRLPSEAERGAVTLHLAQRPNDRVAAIRQIVWALLASPEFRFNH